MKMKTKFFFVLMMAVFMGTQVMNAQNEQGKERKHSRKRLTMEQIADMQANKIVGDLGLDDKTAAKFTDVYKKYMKELDDVRKEFFMEFKKNSGMEKGKDGDKVNRRMQPPTDAEVDKMMRFRFKQSRKMIDVREKYYDEFRKFLSPKQVQKVYDQGQMNPSKFHKEMNRREGMRRPDGGKSNSQK
jgi:hypothetical protein